jgi:hypothetical protein
MGICRRSLGGCIGWGRVLKRKPVRAVLVGVGVFARRQPGRESAGLCTSARGDSRVSASVECSTVPTMPRVSNTW